MSQTWVYFSPSLVSYPKCLINPNHTGFRCCCEFFAVPQPLINVVPLQPCLYAHHLHPLLGLGSVVVLSAGIMFWRVLLPLPFLLLFNLDVLAFSGQGLNQKSMLESTELLRLGQILL